MQHLQPLTALVAQIERQRDLALADQVKAEAASTAAKAQAEQLVNYRRDYEQRWSAQFMRAGNIELVRCYQGFMERLGQAVDQQARVAAHAEAAFARAQAAVREHEVQLAGVKKLLERRLAEGRSAALRHEQKQTDELAARVAWNQRGAAGRANLS